MYTIIVLFDLIHLRFKVEVDTSGKLFLEGCLAQPCTWIDKTGHLGAAKSRAAGSPHGHEPVQVVKASDSLL